jgi:hypothetical protein
MRATLRPDPASLNPGIDAVEVSVERRSADLVALRYTVTGALDRIVIPPASPPERTDGLWQSTCFELFLKREGEEAYREFNFAPSGAWAAYAFSGYREGMAEAPLPAPPVIRTSIAGDRLEVEVTLALDDAPYATNLTVILEDRAGVRSFWAAKHPEGAPDFHDPGCFIHRLPPAVAP